MVKKALISLDTVLRRFVQSVGTVFLLTVRGIAGIFVPPFNFMLVVKEIDNIGTKSLIVVDLMALFGGMVLALQTIYGLREFGAELYVGTVVALSLVRELGPVFTAIMVGARVGSGIAAEIGSMQVTEQIDAMRALGADPIKKLVTPKIIASMIALPLLAVSADVVGIFGGLVVSIFELNIDYRYYLQSVWDIIEIKDFVSGVGKTVFFGLIISIFGCYYGFGTSGGTTGVGRSTTVAVVTMSVLILISDFFITKLFMLIF